MGERSGERVKSRRREKQCRAGKEEGKPKREGVGSEERELGRGEIEEEAERRKENGEPMRAEEGGG